MVPYLPIILSTKLVPLLDSLCHGLKTDAFFLSKYASWAGTYVPALLVVSGPCF